VNRHASTVLGAFSGRAFAQLVDKPLLRGAHIVGTVLELDVRPYTTKGSLEYPTAVTYAFTAPDGRRFTNFTRRTLVSPPGLQRGGPIDVLYQPSNPSHSTMSKGFALDMAAEAGRRLAIPANGVLDGALRLQIYAVAARDARPRLLARICANFPELALHVVCRNAECDATRGEADHGPPIPARSQCARASRCGDSLSASRKAAASGTAGVISVRSFSFGLLGLGDYGE